MVVFFTGPVRSGKSRLAQELAKQSALPVTFVATARVDPNDSEWLRRLARHRAERPAGWNVVETGVDPPVDLPRYVAAADAERTLVVDSVGTWLDACIVHALPTAGDDVAALELALNAEARRLIEALQATRAQTIVIGEEVGWGIVPLAASARIFRDVAGRAQQRIAALAQRSYLVVAGHAIDIRAATSPDGLAPEGWR